MLTWNMYTRYVFVCLGQASRRHRRRIHTDRSIVVRERRYRDCVRHVDDSVLRGGGAEGRRCVLQHLSDRIYGYAAVVSRWCVWFELRSGGT